jgi:hypothetical protein
MTPLLGVTLRAPRGSGLAVVRKRMATGAEIHTDEGSYA